VIQDLLTTEYSDNHNQNEKSSMNIRQSRDLGSRFYLFIYTFTVSHTLKVKKNKTTISVWIMWHLPKYNLPTEDRK
jgi:hypothetical protein